MEFFCKPLPQVPRAHARHTVHGEDARLATFRAFTPCFATPSQIQSLWNSSQQPIPNKKRIDVFRQSQTCPDPQHPKEGRNEESNLRKERKETWSQEPSDAQNTSNATRTNSCSLSLFFRVTMCPVRILHLISLVIYPVGGNPLWLKSFPIVNQPWSWTKSGKTINDHRSNSHSGPTQVSQANMKVYWRRKAFQIVEQQHEQECQYSFKAKSRE